MSVKEIVVLCLLVIFIEREIGAEGSRQKRCIVIQKQSGSRGDSGEAEDDDDDYRRPKPKEPSQSDRFRKPAHEDVESVPPESLNYKLTPMRLNNEYKLKRRLFRKYL